MANTFTQLYSHVVFATRYRDGFINSSWQEELHRYITGIVQNKDHKMLAINSMPDHLHMFVGMKPDQSISSLVQTVKSESSKWIKAQCHCNLFAWQEGFAAFSNSKSQLSQVISYIENQQVHHHKKSFLEEYKQMLCQSGIEFDEKYIFIEPI
jgi:putative transposase